MAKWTIVGLLAMMAPSLSGCSGSSSGTEVVAAAPAQPTRPALGTVTKLNLDESDRAALAEAQMVAFDSGQKQKWQGKINFGYVDPGPASSGLRGECRSYKQTIIISGRAREEQGQACKDQGSWKIS